MGIYGQNTHPRLFSYKLLIEAKKLECEKFGLKISSE